MRALTAFTAAMSLLVAGCVASAPPPVASTTPGPSAHGGVGPGSSPVSTRLRPVPGAAGDAAIARCAQGRAFVSEPPARFEPLGGSPTLKLLSHLGGASRTLALRGDRLYLGVGPRIEVLDTTSGLRSVGASDLLDDDVRGIAVEGSVGIAAVGPSGIVTLDLSESDRPRSLAKLELSGSAEAVALQGATAYIADASGGVAVVDLKAPDKPRRIATVTLPAYALGIAVSGAHGYVAGGSAGVIPLDLGDPGRPLSRTPIPVPGFAVGVALSGDTLAVSATWGGVSLLDLSDRSAPRLIGGIATPSWAMAAVFAEDGRLHVAAASAGLRVLDRQRLVELDSYDLPRGHAAAIVARGGTVYVADLYQGVLALDVAGRPKRVAAHSPVAGVHDLTVSGGVAYVGEGDAGLRALDVSEPASPRELSRLDFAEEVIGVARSAGGVIVATVARGSDTGTNSVFRSAVSPTGMVSLSRPQPMPGPYRSGRVMDGVAFWTNEWGLQILDVKGPQICEHAALNVVDQGNTQGAASAVDVVGKVAFVGIKGDPGLLAVDVSDLGAPRISGRLSAPNAKSGFGEGIIAAGRYLYALGSGEFYVIEASDPAAMKVVGRMELPAEPGGTSISPQKLAVAGGHVIVAGGAAGILAIDVSRPAEPRIALRMDLFGPVTGVVVDDGLIYASSVRGGLTILRWRDPPGPAQPLAVAPGLEDATTAAGVAAVAVPSPVAPLAHGTATCRVTSTADDGAGTLRRCLADVAGGGTVTFDPGAFPSSRPAVIRTTRPLSVGTGVTLDASGAGVTLVHAGDPKGDSVGLQLDGDESVIRGLTVEGFWAGILVSGRRNVIGGPDPLDGNILAGNQVHDLYLKGARGTLVQGNSIGTGPSRTSLAIDTGAQGNRLIGNLIGGAVTIDDTGTSYNALLGNHIGVDRAGAVLAGDVEIAIFQPFNRFGGAAPGESNVVHGTLVVGSSELFVMGNVIGTHPQSGAVWPRRGSAVQLRRLASHSYVGGPAPGERNVLAASLEDTVVDLRDHTASTFVVGNEIFGGETGVAVNNGRWNVVQANEIHDTRTAIDLRPGAERNRVLANRMRANEVDLVDRGVANVKR